MADYREHIVDVELEAGQVHRSFVNFSIGEGDINSQRYGVRLFRNGEPENVSGSVVGYFIRPDGNTVALTGSKSGNEAWVTLSQSCCAVEGQFMLAIKITSGSMSNTVRIIDGTIVDTVKGAVIDPGNVIPSLADYTDLAEAIEAAAESIEGITIDVSQIEGTRYKLIAAIE